MTKPASATQAQINRAIRAAVKAGLRVSGIAPNGTVLIDSSDSPTKIILPIPADDWMKDREL
jgi:hypothetical protein